MEGREWGDKCSKRYNARVRHATLLYALLHQLRFPTPCFRELIRQHCKLKRQLIFETIDKWLQELHELGMLDDIFELIWISFFWRRSA